MIRGKPLNFLLSALKEIGLNCAIIGVQDFDQQSIHHIQTEDAILCAFMMHNKQVLKQLEFNFAIKLTELFVCAQADLIALDDEGMLLRPKDSC